MHSTTKHLTIELALGWTPSKGRDPDANCDGGGCGSCPTPGYEHEMEEEWLRTEPHGQSHHDRRHLDVRPMKKLHASILGLAEMIRLHLRELITFSFTIDAAPADLSWCGCYKPFLARHPIVTLLKALPPTCVNLELDTAGADRSSREFTAFLVDHPEDLTGGEESIETFQDPIFKHSETEDISVCKAIQDMLPRLEHLRLRFQTLCPVIIGLSPEMRNKTPPEQLNNSFPNLKTMVINQIVSPRQRDIELCTDYRSATKSKPWSTQSKTHHLDDIAGFYEFAGAMRACQASFPNLKKCQIISDIPSLGGTEASLKPHRERLTKNLCKCPETYDIRCFDVLRNQTIILPCEPVSYNLTKNKTAEYPPYLKASVFRDSNDEVHICSSRNAEAMVEDAWSFTSTGLRAPRSIVEHQKHGRPQKKAMVDMALCEEAIRRKVVKFEGYVG